MHNEPLLSVTTFKDMLTDAINLLQEGKPFSVATKELQDSYTLDPITARRIVDMAADLDYHIKRGERLKK